MTSSMPATAVMPVGWSHKGNKTEVIEFTLFLFSVFTTRSMVPGPFLGAILFILAQRFAVGFIPDFRNGHEGRLMGLSLSALC